MAPLLPARMAPLLTLLLLLLSSCSALEERPNMIVFLVDDLGHGDLGYLGHPTTSSPNIDALAQDSVELTQFYTASSVCTPSRASLLTGRHSVRTGLYPRVLYADSLGGLPLQEETLAENLGELGYRTAMTGKWHLGVGLNGSYLPTRQGFHRYYGMPYSHDMCPFQNCFPEEDGSCDAASPHPLQAPCPLYRDDRIVEQPADLTTLTARYTDFAEEFILEESAEPFFLYFAFNHVHFPQFSSSAFRNSSARGSFGDAVAEVDWSVGRLVNTLRDTGLLDNTLILLTSDNGPRTLNQGKGQGGSSGLFKCGKGTTYEGGQRVPALLHWPAHLTPRKHSGIVSMLDIYPTLVSLAGGSPSPVDGLDLSPSLLAGLPTPRQEIVYINPNSEDGQIHALRLGAYKAHWQTQGGLLSTNNDLDCIDIKRRHDPPQLYNVETDPQELYIIKEANEPKYAEILALMEARRAELEGGEILWAESTLGGRAEEAKPCCSPGCTPFPTCCSCQEDAQDSSIANNKIV